MLIPRTEMHPLGILRTPFDIVFNAISDYGYNPEASLPKYMFYYKGAHISGPKGSPDMMFNHFT